MYIRNLSLFLTCFSFLFLSCVSDPLPCASGADCSDKNTVCRNNACVEQGKCSKNEDCQYKKEICKEGLCVLDHSLKPDEPKKACLSACSRDIDCALCQNGRTQCIRSICAVKERAKAFERCGDSVGKACPDRMICIGALNQYCIPECDPTNKRCEGGTAGCYDPRKTGAGICLPDGGSKEGGTCTANFIGETKIDTSMICPNGLRCVKSVCRKPIKVGAYQQCGGGRVCDSGASCIFLQEKAKFGYCLPLCDVNKGTCSGGGRCVRLKSQKGVCLPKGTAQINAGCSPSGPVLQGKDFCANGLVCAQLSKDTSPICLQSVAKCSQTSCPQGTACLSGRGGALCASLCQTNQTCSNGFVCVAVRVGNRPVGVCTLK